MSSAQVAEAEITEAVESIQQERKKPAVPDSVSRKSVKSEASPARTELEVAHPKPHFTQRDAQ